MTRAQDKVKARVHKWVIKASNLYNVNLHHLLLAHLTPPVTIKERRFNCLWCYTCVLVLAGTVGGEQVSTIYC